MTKGPSNSYFHLVIQYLFQYPCNLCKILLVALADVIPLNIPKRAIHIAHDQGSLKSFPLVAAKHSSTFLKILIVPSGAAVVKLSRALYISLFDPFIQAF